MTSQVFLIVIMYWKFYSLLLAHFQNDDFFFQNDDLNKLQVIEYSVFKFCAPHVTLEVKYKDSFFLRYIFETVPLSLNAKFIKPF